MSKDPDSLTAKEFQELVAKKNAEVTSKNKRKSTRSTVHSTLEDFVHPDMDMVINVVEKALKQHFTNILYEEVDRHKMKFITDDGYQIDLSIRKKK